MATMNKEIEVNKGSAEFFYDQCAGTHSGHMAHIPNNPILHSILGSHGVNNKQKFAEFLRQVADQLDNKEQS